MVRAKGSRLRQMEADRDSWYVNDPDLTLFSIKVRKKTQATHR